MHLYHKKRLPVSSLFLLPSLLRRVRHQRDMAGTLDSDCQFPLVAGAGARHAPGQNLGALRYKPAQARHVFVVNRLYPIHAKAAYLAAAFFGRAGIFAFFIAFTHELLTPSCGVPPTA